MEHQEYSTMPLSPQIPVIDQPKSSGSKCFLCRSESRSTAKETEGWVSHKDFVLSAWKNATLESFCVALDLPMDLAKMLRNEDFCSECTLELQDLDWAVRTLQRLQHQIELTKRKIEEKLKGQAGFLSADQVGDYLGRAGHNMTMLLKCLGIWESQVEATQNTSFNEPVTDDSQKVVIVLKEEPMEIEEFHQVELNSDSFTMDDIPETDHHEANENFVESVKLEREDCGVGSGSVVSENFDHDSKQSIESATDEELDADYEPEPDTKAPSNALLLDDIPETENFLSITKLEREDGSVGSLSVIREDFDYDSKGSEDSATDEELDVDGDLDYEPEPEDESDKRGKNNRKAPSTPLDIEDKKRILKFIADHPTYGLRSIQCGVHGGRKLKHRMYIPRWEKQIKEYEEWLESNKTRCDRCDKGYCTKQKFIAHLNGDKCCYGKKNWPVMCSICSKGFATEEENLSHQSAHDPVHPLVCTDCGETMTNSEDLKEHMRSHQRDPCPGSFCKTCLRHYPNQIFQTHNCRPYVKKFICELCGKPFKNNAHLARHKLSHSDDRTILCDLCPWTFKFDYSLSLHKKTVHGIINQSKRSQSNPQTAISPSPQSSSTNVQLQELQ